MALMASKMFFFFFPSKKKKTDQSWILLLEKVLLSRQILEEIETHLKIIECSVREIGLRSYLYRTGNIRKVLLVEVQLSCQSEDLSYADSETQNWSGVWS